MGAPIFQWTEEAITDLLALYRSGKTYTQMAAHFGVSKNTISGKLDRTLRRLGERVTRTVRSDTVAKRKYTRSESMLTLPRSAESVSKYVAPALPKPDEGQIASIVDVTGCRWPVRDDVEFVGGIAFCNHQAAAGASYCPYHTKVSSAAYSRKLIRETVRSAIFVYERAA